MYLQSFQCSSCRSTIYEWGSIDPHYLKKHIYVFIQDFLYIWSKMLWILWNWPSFALWKFYMLDPHSYLTPTVRKSGSAPASLHAFMPLSPFKYSLWAKTPFSGSYSVNIILIFLNCLESQILCFFYKLLGDEIGDCTGIKMYIGRYMEGIAQTTKIRETIGVVILQKVQACKQILRRWCT